MLPDFSNLNTGSGTLALKYSGSPAISAYGTVTLSNSTTLTVVNTTGAPLTAGSYKIISTNNGGSIAGTLPSVAVTGGGTAGGSTNLLKIVDGELYLVVDQPLAATMTVHRTAGLRLLIALADVATNWSNAAGYTPSLAGLNLVTTNGVNLMTNSNWILYTNSPNVNDQISYTIRDSLGWPATGLINVVVDSSVTGTNSIANINIGGSTNAVTAYGIPGYSYILERATNLVPAIWVDVSTNTAATNGVINATDGFIDLGNVPPGSAYYRLKWHP